MPLNLPAEALSAEKRYRAAKSMAEKIACLQEFISAVPKHKGTDRLRADLRKRLSKLQSSSQGKKGRSKRESAFLVDKEGAGQVVLVGPTNVGKSALVAALTNATPQVSASTYTTWSPTPGMMLMEDAQIQLVDTPPLHRDFVEPELLGLIRRADLMLLVVNLQADPLQELEDTLALLEEHGIVPQQQQGRSGEQRRLAHIPLLVVVNKNDDERSDEDFEIFCELLEDDWPLLPVSATTGRNFDDLKRAVFERLGVMRIYTKPPGKAPDLGAPFLLETGGTVAEFAAKVHQDFAEKLKTARVWGSVAHDGQMVGRDHILCDGDIVELRI